MTNNQFEKQISDKLDQFEVEPSDGLLESIFEKRASRPRFAAAHRVSRIILVSVVLTSCFLAVYFLSDYKTQTDLTENSASEQKGNNVPALTEKTKQESNDVKESNTNTVIKNNNLRAETVRTPGIKKQAKNALVVNNINTFEINNNSSVLKSGNSNASYEFENVAERYFDVTAKNRPVISQVEHNGNSHLYVFQTADESLVDAINFMGIKPSTINNLKLRYKADALEKVNHNFKAFSFKRRKPLFIDALVSPMISTTGSSNNAGLKTYADNLAISSVNTQFGLRITLPVYKRYSIFTGLSYLNHVNAYKGSIWTESEKEKIVKNTTYINDPVLGVIKVETYDTSTIMVGKSTNYDIRNNYKLFQVPIGVAFNFGYKNFDFAVNGSALFNIFMNSKGKTMDVKNNRTEGFNSDRKYMSLGSGLSFMGAYKISPKLRLIVEPGIQLYKIQSIKAGNNFNENVINRQLNLGIRYTLF